VNKDLNTVSIIVLLYLALHRRMSELQAELRGCIQRRWAFFTPRYLFSQLKLRAVAITSFSSNKKTVQMPLATTSHQYIE